MAAVPVADQATLPLEGADPAPVEEQTEALPEVDLSEESAAEPVEEAAATDRVSALEAELAELKAQRERDAAALREQSKRDAAEEIRRENQIRQQAEAKRQQQERERKDRSLREAKLHLHEAGLTDIPTESLTPAFDAYVSESRTAYRTAALQDASDAWLIASAKYFQQSLPPDFTASPEAYESASKYTDFASAFGERVASDVRDQLVSEGWKSPDDVKAAIAAGVKAELQKIRPQEDIAKIEGTVAGEMTPERWSSLGPEGRKDPKNIAAWDAYIASHPNGPQ